MYCDYCDDYMTDEDAQYVEMIEMTVCSNSCRVCGLERERGTGYGAPVDVDPD